MRNLILGTVGGLVVGTMGALAYSHYLGDGSTLGDLQAKLDDANADLAKLKAYHVQTARLASSTTEQTDELASENADLRKQLDAAKSGAPTAAPAPAPELNVSTLAGLMMGMMRGGGGPFQAQQRLFTMQARLHLTPDQAAKIKAAMDADQQARRELMRQRFGFGGGRGGGGPGGGPGGPGGGGPNGGGNNGGTTAAAGAPATPPATDNLQKAVASVLTYQQQADYQKLQTDEKAAQAETSATSQVNGVMPLLQLTDSQKEAAMQQLYQVQLNAPDPNSLIASPNPMAAFGQQAQATQAVLAKVLTPDQMTLYQQQAKAQSDAMAQFQPGGQGRQRGNPNGGNPNAAGGTTTGASTATTAAVTPPATSTTPAADSTAATTNAATATTPAATTNADGTPATPAASTNAAPVTQ